MRPYSLTKFLTGQNKTKQNNNTKTKTRTDEFYCDKIGMRFCFCLLMSCFGADVQRLAFPPFSALTLLLDRKDIWLVCKKNPSAITKRSYLDLFGGPGITRNNIWKRPVTQKNNEKSAHRDANNAHWL